MDRILTYISPFFIILLFTVTSAHGAALPYIEQTINYDDFLNEAPSMKLEQLVRHAWEEIQQEHYDAAAAYYYVAASRYDPALPPRDIRRCALANVNMGYIWLAWRMNAAEAYPWLMKAQAIATRHNLRDIESAVISNLGQIYFDYNNIPKGCQLLRESFQRVMADSDHHYFGRALIDYAYASLHYGAHSIPDSLIDEMTRYRIDADAPLAAYAPRLIEALRLLRQGRPEQGAATLEDATPLLRLDSDTQRYTALQHLCVGLMWMAADEWHKGATAIEKGVEIAREMEYFNLLEKSYGYLEECTRHTGTPQEVRQYHLEMLQIRDSLFNASRFEAFKDMQISDRLASLNRDIHEASTRAEKQQRRIFIALGISVMLIATIVMMYIKHQRLRDAYREIYKRNLQLSTHPLLPLPPVTGNDPASPTEGNPPGSADTGAAHPDTIPQADHDLMLRVRTLLEQQREIFNPDFSVDTMARMLDIREKTLSQTINRVTGKNFNTLLSEYRIREACRLLADTDTMRSATIESVAESVGYRSRTYFSSVFKNIVGMPPSQFIRQARRNNEK
ncbi:MAG: AraC family transcriptional regulator [Muribaculaceae bacterium]|nr:AraC family transcriptional regulator [Muribaculaceae bacterium]